jgi:branched-chain amino acid transport system permease protein
MKEDGLDREPKPLKPSKGRTPLAGLIYRKVRSVAGIVIILTIITAIMAAIDQGAYVLVNVVVIGGMWALMAMGLSLMFSVMNIPNFAYGEFFMIGTLVAYFIFSPLNSFLGDHPHTFWTAVIPLLAILGATCAGGVTGALTEKIVFYQLRKRTREQWLMNCFALTVGLSVIMINGHQLIFGTGYKGIVQYWDVPPVSFLDAFISFERVFAFFLAIVTATGFWIFLKFTKTGKAIRAVSEDEAGALMMGIDYDRVQTLTMGLSCALAALAGGTLLFMFPSTPTVGIQPLYYSWFVIIVVGMGNIAGAAAGGFIVALIQVLSRVYIGEGLEYVIPSALMILILIIKPTGIFGSEVKGIWER